MDIARPYLTDEDRSRLSVRIGAGDLASALFALVGRCMRNEVVLPSDVAVTLRDWLHGYSGTEVAAAFEPYVGVVQIVRNVPVIERPMDAAPSSRDRFGNRPRRLSVGSTPPAAVHGVGLLSIATGPKQEDVRCW
ncbi:hypothetical protein [Mycolicibacterium austroafricanum]|uniref:hypothetical protein n=1 Tax=Mycolicibacterium austroafricanum TaxID=39687 RepID=UPI0011AE9251|nr:hypothetical protein [Mycolicibacterium austroafricanum]QZY47032.1 hypothetical protein K5L12_04565 [Mycolicibacterium austroafricanum]